MGTIAVLRTYITDSKWSLPRYLLQNCIIALNHVAKLDLVTLLIQNLDLTQGHKTRPFILSASLFGVVVSMV